MPNDEYDIFKACVSGDIEYIKNCLLCGMNPDMTNQMGQTPLTLAIEFERKDIAELLLKNGADVNFQPDDDWTPLHDAVDSSIDGTLQVDGKLGNEPTEMIQLLLDNGANMNAMTRKGESPLDFAKDYGSQKIIDFLKNYNHKI